MVTILLTLSRLFLGVDFADEAYYIAVPYRFALGDRPFVDDVFVSQSFGLLTQPLIKAYLIATKGLDGIVLFVRLSFLALSCFTATLIYFAIRDKNFDSAFLLVSAAFVAFIPFGLPSLGYSQLGILLSALAAFLYYWKFQKRSSSGAREREEEPSSHLSDFIAMGLVGGLISLAGIAHPGLSPGLLLVLIGFTASCPQKKVSWMGILGAGFVVLFVVFAYELSAGAFFSSIQKMTEYNRLAADNSFFQKLKFFFEGLGRSGLIHPIFLVWLSLYLFIHRRKVVLEVLLLGVLPLVAFLVTRARSGGFGFNGFPFFIGLVAPLFYFRQNNKEGSRRLLVYLWAPFAVISTNLSFVSNSGVTSGACVFWPAMTVTLALLLHRLEFLSASRPSGKSYLNSVRILAPALCVVALLYLQYSSLYREEPRAKLVEIVSTGPYRGLYTSSLRKQFIESLQKDLTATVPNQGRIVFHCFFPGGYLMTPLRPGTPSVWGCGPLGDSACSRLHEPFESQIAYSVSISGDLAPALGIWKETCPLAEAQTQKSLKVQLIKSSYVLNF